MFKNLPKLGITGAQAGVFGTMSVQDAVCTNPLDTLQPQQLWPGNSWAATWIFGRIRGKIGQKKTPILQKKASSGQIWTFFSDFCIFCLIRAKWVQKVGKIGVKQNRPHSVLEFRRVSSGLYGPRKEKKNPKTTPDDPVQGNDLTLSFKQNLTKVS